MATVTLNQSFDFLTPQDWQWEVNESSDSFFSITDGVHTQTFRGSFSYDHYGVHGTVTSTNFYIHGDEVYKVLGMLADANKLQDYLETYGDTQKTYAYVLQGADSITGSGGDDRILGYAGNDKLYGGAGNDKLDGGAGNDYMKGGSGNDIYYINSTGDTVYETVGAGTDRVYATVSDTLDANVENLYLSGTAAKGTGNTLNNIIHGTNYTNNLYGLAGNDTIYGMGGNDKLYGGTGNDKMNGGSGNDYLYGDASTDNLIGGLGTDRLYGGSDSYRDVFDFNSITESKVGSSYRDNVYNFKSGIDDIDLKTIDANANLSGDQSFHFSNKTAAAYSVWYVQADIDSDGLKDDIIVKCDVNGNTTADFELGVVGVTTVAAGDFVL
ncbi:Hemolysin-type calcium-binding repeat-containing protein [Syntrophus gentianae]|uniref:Hemolysin-type calcium-binding repeat-containing protein n=1 Tax=Syntrophus gentianae TaxID=43775 RepID=A0A1H7VP69_9BACT|nr:calcium-binding protein [Syntrophus gentianae]SEM10824.1 Hemolysin-type calcium-binding repeat-containing protein [Syntrophus gentianae]